MSAEAKAALSARVRAVAFGAPGIDGPGVVPGLDRAIA